jgi:hypothetical protein
MLSTPISVEDRRKIEQFIEVFVRGGCHAPAVLTEPEAYLAQRIPGQVFWVAPRAMLCGPPDAEGNAAWQPIDSPIDEAMVAGFERFLLTPLPPLFKAYLTQKCLIGMDLYEGWLPDIDPREPFKWLEWCALQQKLPFYEITPWLLPFTYAAAQVGTLCFDTRQPDDQGDYPIVLVGEGSGRQVFDSFASYIDHLQNWLAYRSSGSEVHFFTWLEENGKVTHQAYYDAL